MATNSMGHRAYSIVGLPLVTLITHSQIPEYDQTAVLYHRTKHNPAIRQPYVTVPQVVSSVLVTAYWLLLLTYHMLISYSLYTKYR